jgi:hypothetical protein
VITQVQIVRGERAFGEHFNFCELATTKAVAHALRHVKMRSVRHCRRSAYSRRKVSVRAILFALIGSSNCAEYWTCLHLATHWQLQLCEIFYIGAS